MNKEFVQDLIKGSHNIDRMRREIKEVVGMMLGLFADLYETRTINNGSIVEICRQKEFVWTISKEKNRLMGAEAWVELSSDLSGYVSGYNTSGTHSKELRWVKQVHDSLPMFVEGMMKKFPGLEEELRPLLAASEK
jgi:hypothetical protein